MSFERLITIAFTPIPAWIWGREKLVRGHKVVIVWPIGSWDAFCSLRRPYLLRSLPCNVERSILRQDFACRSNNIVILPVALGTSRSTYRTYLMGVVKPPYQICFHLVLHAR